MPRSWLLALLALVVLAGAARIAFSGEPEPAPPSPGHVESRENLRALAASPVPASLSVANAEGPVIDQRQARKILSDLWAHREAVLYTVAWSKRRSDERRLALYETGPAAEGHRMVLQIARKIDSGTGWTARVFHGGRVWVPRQTKFPAYFVAQVRTTRARTATGEDHNSPYTSIIVVGRQSRRDRWRVVVETGELADEYGPPWTAPLPETQPDGFTPEPVTWIDGREAFDRYLAYQLYWRVAGREPPRTPFKPGEHTTVLGQEKSQFPQDRPAGPGGPVIHSRFYTDRRDPIFEVGLDAHTRLACGTGRRHATFKPERRGGLLYQPHRGTGYGIELPEGHYEYIERRELFQTCIVIGRRESDGLIVFGYYGGGVVTSSVREPGPLS